MRRQRFECPKRTCSALEQSVKAQQAAVGRRAGQPQTDRRAQERACHDDRPTRTGARQRGRQRRPSSATRKIYAPIDGIVSVRVARQGEVVAQGSPIVVIVDIDHLWVQRRRRRNLHRPDQIRPEDARAASLGDVIEGRSFSREWKAISPRSATSAERSATSRRLRSRYPFRIRSAGCSRA